MSNRDTNETETIQIEPYSLFADVIRNLWVILIGALACAMAAEIIQTAILVPEYTTDATFVVTSKRGSGLIYNNLSAANRMAESFSNILSSDVMKSRVCKDLEMDSFDAETTASSVPNTNLVLVSVTADTPYKSYIIMKSIMNNYADIIIYQSTEMVMEVLQEPEIPETSSNAVNMARLRRNYFFYGFFALIVLFMYLSYKHDTIKSKYDQINKLDGKALGAIPYEKRKRKAENRSLLVTENTVSMSYAEEYRQIIVKLMKEAEEHNARSILITGVQEHEGKTTTAANLALTLARQGRKVVLLDCDLRRPALADLFRVEVKPGHTLADFLHKNASFTDVVYQDPKVKNLYIMFQDKGYADSTEIVGREALSSMVEDLKNYVEYIILDSPPMALMADAEDMANVCDMSVLVVQYDRSLASDINDSIDLLREKRAHFAGTILNGYKTLPGLIQHTSSYGKYGYGYGKYSYGYGSYYRKPSDTASDSEETEE